MSIKTRTYKVGPVGGQTRSSGFGTWAPYVDLGVDCSETSISHSHHWVFNHWSGGGPWDLFRETVALTPPSVDVSKTSGSNQIIGSARMGSNLSATYPIGAYSHPSDSELNALGTTAIARVEPTNPAFDLSTFIGELRAEGLPNLPGLDTRSKVAAAKSAGGNYLNVEFGWLPLVRGVRDFANTVKNSDDIVRSYQENANKVIRRSYEWPIEEETHAEAVSFGSVPGSGGSWTGGGRWQSKRQKKWFEADFTYYLPTGGSTNDKFRRYGSYARKLYGIELTPEVLWNLAPWSWAADWFGNMGDVMHNVSNIGSDGMVMRNGYVMCHTQKVIVDSGKNTLALTKGVRVTTSERKSRRNAMPYGFGLTYSDLTAKQVAIISALGLSHLPG